MAQDDGNDQVELVEGIEDTARPLTSGIVIATSVILLVAFVVMESALGHWFKLGPFKG